MRLTRPLRLLGYAMLLVIALSKLHAWLGGDPCFGPPWICAFTGFVLAYAFGAPTRSRTRERRIAALAVETVAMLVMSATSPCLFGSLTLVILAWQVACLFRPRVTAIFLVAQTAVMAACVARSEGGDAVWEALEMLGFQAFAAIAVTVAEREHAACCALSRVNAELRATRALLAESTRAEERMRIARDLHDLMGHDLTALGLQLEVARNVTVGKAHEHVAKARAMSDQLLDDVRGVVGAMRAPEGRKGIDLARALAELLADTPGLRVHLDTPDGVRVEDGARAQCVLRCVQEIVTNTLRHACAGNLWIRVVGDGSGITVEARDDGRGASGFRPGNGLAGMRERLESLGGRLRVHATPACAFALSAWLPSGEATS
jgi:signal transduction histidine kinase